MSETRLQELYEQMLLLRHFDQLSMRLKLKDLIYSGYHPYEGQEAVAVGFCGALEKDDVLLSTHRPHCHAAAKGCTLEAILTEMMGRVTGCSGGLGGGMQYLDPDHNFYCGSIVGSNLPIATGIGMAIAATLIVLRRKGSGTRTELDADRFGSRSSPARSP